MWVDGIKQGNTQSGKITKDTTLEKTADFKIQAEVEDPRKETEKSTLRNRTEWYPGYLGRIQESWQGQMLQKC